MWILAAILFFIFESIAAAGKGDRSGLDIIGKVLMAIGTFSLLVVSSLVFQQMVQE